jgi:hypothetical protein
MLGQPEVWSVAGAEPDAVGPEGIEEDRVGVFECHLGRSEDPIVGDGTRSW